MLKAQRWKCNVNVNLNSFFILFSFPQEVNSVYRILAAILNTGNIEFTSISSQHQTDKSQVPNSEALENGESSELHAQVVCNMQVVISLEI